MKPGDTAVIVAVLITAVILLAIQFFNSDSGNSYVKIGDTIYDLNENNVIMIENNGYHLTVNIENGHVYVSESDCPDGICRMSGKIYKSGQSIACVPAGIYIEIEGSRLNVDSIAG